MSDTGKAYVPESQDDDDAGKEVKQHYVRGAAKVEPMQATSDQGADLALTTAALSGGSGVQAIPSDAIKIRFTIKGIAAGATAWANIKFGTVAVVVTSSTGTSINVGDGEFTVTVPDGATHFDAISGAALTLNWTPA